ncbi:Putative S-adenosyl-L-methionine-dependent methyltransferase [Septoria linicola]|uniref:S-adenosyl-L-methionine-dependent methyltransferase n=1 Tax=Septoria linicola TaxID=215465 RepID=A0A9Q9AN31_9PEZI|nr:putative S-adenosyl-L-methionine-dependent methyltransferase [Septoria linicola]USW51995.1 Putative S-adenosyl-L-methionine-dependent methyltransferase [Septoria linicola]
MATTRSDSVAETYISNDPKYHTHKDAAYVLPNDNVEHERLEAQAKHLQAIMNNEIIHSPISKDLGKDREARILDIGCGTGIVTDYLGARFPHAQVYGLDISPVPIHIRPSHPPNVHFLQGNIVTNTSPSSWLPQSPSSAPLQSEDKFDLIFSRLLVCGMTSWPDYISSVHSLLARGGHIELHDIDWTWYSSKSPTPEIPISDSSRWLNACKKAALKKGMDWEAPSHFSTYLSSAGFKDITVKKYKWIHGGQWETDPVWKAWGDFVVEEIQGLGWHVIPRTLEGEGYSEEEIRVFREEMLRDFEAEEGKYWEMSVVTGRK